MPTTPSRKTLLMHPDTAVWFRRQFPAINYSEGDLHATAQVLGMQIRESEACPRFETRWFFPEEHAITYEASDEAWCRFFGFGHEAEDPTRRACYIIGNLWEIPCHRVPAFHFESDRRDHYVDALKYAATSMQRHFAPIQAL